MQQLIQRIIRALAVGYIVRGIKRLISKSSNSSKNKKDDNNDKSQ